MCIHHLEALPGKQGGRGLEFDLAEISTRTRPAERTLFKHDTRGDQIGRWTGKQLTLRFVRMLASRNLSSVGVNSETP
jgi:hypothetical protein